MSDHGPSYSPRDQRGRSFAHTLGTRSWCRKAHKALRGLAGLERPSARFKGHGKGDASDLSPHRKTQVTMKGERTPRCQCQKRSLPRCLRQTASRDSTAQCPDRQSAPYRKHNGMTGMHGIHACQGRRPPPGGSLEGDRPGRAAATPPRAKSTHRIDKIVAKALGIWPMSGITDNGI